MVDFSKSASKDSLSNFDAPANALNSLNRTERQSTEQLRRLLEPLGADVSALWPEMMSRPSLERRTVEALKHYETLSEATTRELIHKSALPLLASLGFKGDTLATAIQALQGYHALPQTGIISHEVASLIERDWDLVAHARMISFMHRSYYNPARPIPLSNREIFGYIAHSGTFVLANPAHAELLELTADGSVKRHPKGQASLERFGMEAKTAVEAAPDRGGLPHISAWEDPTHAFHTSRSRDDVTGESSTHIALRRRNPQSSLRITVLDLQGRGDAILLRSPQSRHVLVDAGLSREAATRIVEILPPHLSLDVVASHPDADHIANIVRILTKRRIDELLMSSFPTPTAIRAKLLQQLSALAYEEHKLSGTTMSHFGSHTPRTSFVRVPLAPGIGHRRSDVALFTATIEPGVDVSIAQIREPRTSNESSLVIHVRHNGHSTLLTGDISARVMRIFSNHYEAQKQRRPYADALSGWTTASHWLPIKADSFKWPHHAWLPKDAAARAELKRFLKHVNPSRILVSVGPEDLRGQSVQELKDFVLQVLPQVKVFVTREDGSIGIETRFPMYFVLFWT